MIFGILTRQGQVFAELVSGVEARNLMPLTARAYTGLAAKGYLHRSGEHGDKEYVRGQDKTNQINGLESFWGFLNWT